MNKKLKIIIGIIALLVLILIIVNILKNENIKDKNNSSEEETTVSNIKYDDNMGQYYIEDEETGEILHTADSEEELYIYTIDPDYDPKMPISEENSESEIVE